MYPYYTCKCPAKSIPDILWKAVEMFGGPNPMIEGRPMYEWEVALPGKKTRTSMES